MSRCQEDRQATLASPEGELTATIHIDVTEIPDHVRDRLAAATMDFIHGILRQPGGRERLDAKIAARKATQAAQQNNG